MTTTYIGFDLGTTNSAAASFDGDTVTVMRSSQGEALTPSIVRLSSSGGVLVGQRARRYLETDPANTHTGFKRLMGTGTSIAFPAAGVTRTPEELSAEVLRLLCDGVEQQCGFRPTRAIVTVPALFEIPQNAATVEAARLAGLEQVELLQEPVASALAAGWTATDARGSWLVYDMGGGTFDVSLLESRHGLLRVVGHDGDNFLGGRDIDRAIVDWVVERQAAAGGPTLDRSNPDHEPAFRCLSLAAEEAKIELSRSETAVIANAWPIDIDGESLEIELEFDRKTLDALTLPMVDRSMDVVTRLLHDSGLRAEQIGRVVLVGGPTLMPVLRKRLAERLGAPIDDSMDPMTMVARGAALYAATAGLAASGGDAPRRGSAPDSATGDTSVTNAGCHFFLHYPPVTADLTPHVVGRLVDSDVSTARPTEVRLVRTDGGTEGEYAPLDEEGAFVASVQLEPHKANTFRLEARDSRGDSLTCEPSRITLVHGVTIGDPPLSRTVGVALANGGVREYFARGTPLPSRRTFVHRTVSSVSPVAAVGSVSGSALRIPLVQGEYASADLCRLVGAIEVDAKDLSGPLPADSTVEVTLELDRGGHLSASAFVSALSQTFKSVAHLMVPAATPEVLRSHHAELAGRLVSLREEAFRTGRRDSLKGLSALQARLDTVARDVEAAKGGDVDAAQRSRRVLLEVDSSVGELEDEQRWPEIEDDAVWTAAWASSQVASHGSPAEQKLLEQAIRSLEAARQAKSVTRLKRQQAVVQRLGSAAAQRDDSTWEHYFHNAAAESNEASDLPRASKLVAEGHQALESRDHKRLRTVVRELWGLLPRASSEPRKTHGSSVR